MQLIKMKQADLEGCRERIEEVVDGKGRVLLVGGRDKVRMDNRKPRTVVEVENSGGGGAGEKCHRILWRSVYRPD